MKWSVALHGNASARVEVEADSYVEANRKAIEAAPKTKYVKGGWTPVSTSRIDDLDGGEIK